MVNIGFGVGSLVGIALALGGVALYFLRTFRPALARDQDIALAVIAVGCGGILFFNSWRQDIVLQFGQFMLAGAAAWFAVEAIRLRGIATEQAKRSTPIVDDDRPVSRVYRAELDDLTPIDNNRTVTRRIRGSRDGRSDDVDGYSTSDGEFRRRPSSSRNTDRPGLNGADRPRRPRASRPAAPDRSENRSVWDDDYQDDRSSGWGDSRSASRPGVREDRVSRSPRQRPPQGSSRNRNDDPNYVDYQPIDYPGEDPV
ncbi:MAG: Ycf66 family protein [Drouetiella hepatica Uher 2000/2452]|jgi:hypothetical protein|uniref:Ycf66 family protein n=1 Tax=Drouetiella hepatica Uher 2000/2452 TaxID=904376 RepID=A0A951QBV1_9CYAN|nr:Ycf66 family protein [Drouetiella hepatica Uher 2000/2452]